MICFSLPMFALALAQPHLLLFLFLLVVRLLRLGWVLLLLPSLLALLLLSFLACLCELRSSMSLQQRERERAMSGDVKTRVRHPYPSPSSCVLTKRDHQSLTSKTDKIMLSLGGFILVLILLLLCRRCLAFLLCILLASWLFNFKVLVTGVSPSLGSVCKVPLTICLRWIYKDSIPIGDPPQPAIFCSCLLKLRSLGLREQDNLSANSLTGKAYGGTLRSFGGGGGCDSKLREGGLDFLEIAYRILWSEPPICLGSPRRS